MFHNAAVLPKVPLDHTVCNKYFQDKRYFQDNLMMGRGPSGAPTLQDLSGLATAGPGKITRKMTGQPSGKGKAKPRPSGYFINADASLVMMRYVPEVIGEVSNLRATAKLLTSF